MKFIQKLMLFLGVLSGSINMFSADKALQLLQEANALADQLVGLSAVALNPSVATVLPVDVERFLIKFAPPADIKRLIDQNKDKLLGLKKIYNPWAVGGYKDDGYVGRLETLPGLYIKGEHIDRVINAYRIQRFIDENHIQTLMVPKKYVYKVGPKYMVFAEARDVQDLEYEFQERKVNLQEMNDLILFFESTGYCDVLQYNILRDVVTKKLVIIDTESSSFDFKILKGDFSGRGDLYQSYFRDKASLDRDAKKELREYLTQYKPHDIITLDQNTKYDEPDIDLTVVQKFFPSHSK